MAHTKRGMPGWFPFALAASAVLVLTAGARSGWTLSGDRKPPPPPPPLPPVPPVARAGVLQDWSGVAYRV